jgi:hypothetical protein
MSLTEAELKALIAKGESPTVEFKRQLNLGTAPGKAEFIKDVVALANSAAPVSHLIVGVDDTGAMVGASALERERIQQIIDTYIAPALSVNFLEVQMSPSVNVALQIIDIAGPRKPYYVSRDLERLSANEVLVRHGSVVVRASPIEITEMKDASLGGRDAKRYLRRAELLFRDGKFEGAITASTEAVAIFPSALGHLYRARSYLGLEKRADAERDEATNHKGLWWVWNNIEDPVERQAIERKFDAIDRKCAEYAEAALRDYSDAISLADSADLEKQIRFERLKRWRREDDYKWLEANSRGYEAGKLFYYRTLDLDENDYLFAETTEKAEAHLQKALELGFDTAGVHFLLSQVQLSKHNVGLAFEEIKLAIVKWEKGDRESKHDADKFHALEALIMCRLGRFDKAFDYRYEEALVHGGSSYGDEALGIEEDILCRYAIAFYGGSITQGQDKEGLQIMRILGRHIPELKKIHPRCAGAIEDLLKGASSSK